MINVDPMSRKSPAVTGMRVRRLVPRHCFKTMPHGVAKMMMEAMCRLQEEKSYSPIFGDGRNRRPRTEPEREEGTHDAGKDGDRNPSAKGHLRNRNTIPIESRWFRCGGILRISLFITCYNDTLFPEAGKSVVRVLERLGQTVEFPPGQTCCGQMHANTGYREEALPLLVRFVEQFRDAEAVVCPSSSCVTTMREQ